MKINDTSRLLCVGSDQASLYGYLDVLGGELRCGECSPEFKAMIEPLLKELKGRVLALTECFAGDTIHVGFTPIEPDDLRYMDAAAVALRERGWRAIVLNELQAEAWLLLSAAPVDKYERLDIMNKFNRFSDDAARALIAILKDPKKD